ncbi:MAG: HDIG domain-containing protein, partial [Cyanobacteria bacterium]|nr:HDIG domain-containing protein [Cyanobacteriota bacterium]
FEAPGTFHHSLMVATLCEAAAEAIGANALLARVGSLYHDIGKMKRPLFFIENQAYFGVENPHDRLTPRLSKMVVTAHPRDSVEMARQYQLPDVLTKFMTEHHGTLVAGYFYNQACIQEGEENVNKSQFRYPGPKPNIKETAICMMADACESAVRALKNPTPNQIEERIDKIIKQRVEDGQFENCPITFKDIQMVRDTFVRVIRGFQHQRIEYQQNVIRELGRKIQMTDPSATKSSAPSSPKNSTPSSTMAASGGTGGTVIIDPGHQGSTNSHDPEDPSNDCC